jgi:hypothetical protein
MTSDDKEIEEGYWLPLVGATLEKFWTSYTSTICEFSNGIVLVNKIHQEGPNEFLGQMLFRDGVAFYPKLFAGQRLEKYTSQEIRPLAERFGCRQ